MSISFAEEIHAKETVMQEASISEQERISRLSSCGSLARFALDLFSEKIRPSRGPTLPGLGIDLELDWSRLVTLSCPSDSGPVALALTTGEIGCSCSPNYPTPVASDHKGSTGVGSRRGTLSERLAVECKSHSDRSTVYPRPEFVEDLMGFPIGWTDLLD